MLLNSICFNSLSSAINLDICSLSSFNLCISLFKFFCIDRNCIVWSSISLSLSFIVLPKFLFDNDILSIVYLKFSKSSL